MAEVEQPVMEVTTVAMTMMMQEHTVRGGKKEKKRKQSYWHLKAWREKSFQRTSRNFKGSARGYQLATNEAKNLNRD